MRRCRFWRQSLIWSQARSGSADDPNSEDLNDLADAVRRLRQIVDEVCREPISVLRRDPEVKGLTGIGMAS